MKTPWGKNLMLKKCVSEAKEMAQKLFLKAKERFIWC